ncbi:HupE/UreJ family protein [Croceicoccus bisphenolivorans]|uniref:HupE/UreJ family protein n=1 Tax=Croceicoccus bisphenolivorans TaxID=1783232 RepID=UPI00083716B8|nr:HupE/UreJ family protein [Croceicoccus bisphenolivorans]
MTLTLRNSATALALLAGSQAAFAHPGHGLVETTHGLVAGVVHFITSADHFGSMIVLGVAAIGAFAAFRRRHNRSA